MANALYRKVHNGREFTEIEYFDRVRLTIKLAGMIDRKTVSRAKWSDEPANV
jgi:hypothetical protein